MYRHYNYFMEKNVVTLHPGEYYVTREDEIISTVLGSCVAVVIFDAQLTLGGMNHFMLPGEVQSERRESLFQSEPGKYGMYAMELLINSMLKEGSRRERLQAKIFGGGSVLGGGKNHIPQDNIRFAREYLEEEKIRIISADTGGQTARKILLFPRDFRVLLKRYSSSSQVALERTTAEKDYARRIKKETPRGDVTLFQ